MKSNCSLVQPSYMADLVVLGVDIAIPSYVKQYTSVFLFT